jgi:hypothetical protein
MVKVHCDEGVATRIGPKSCVVIREGYGEASIGECTGQPLSRERNQIPGAEAVQIAEGNTCGCASASARRPGVDWQPEKSHPFPRGVRVEWERLFSFGDISNERKNGEEFLGRDGGP